jgi:hypothetical protein
VIFGCAAFALRDPNDDPAASGPAEYEGNLVDIANEARSFLAHHLRDNDTVDRAEFRSIFGGDIGEVVPTAVAAWQAEGLARYEADVLRFVAQDRRARIHTLLWLVPEQAIEFDLAHFAELELTPRGVELLAEGLRPGTQLAGGHCYGGTEGLCLLITTPHGETLRLRIAPALSDEAPLRLVLETTPRNPADENLRRAVSQLRSVITRNHRRMTQQRERPGGGQLSTSGASSAS